MAIDFCGEPGPSGGYCQYLSGHRGQHRYVVGAWEPGKDGRPQLPSLIGLMGVAGSGKDTVAKYLADYGYGRLAFADAVKQMAVAINPWVGDERTETFSLLADIVEQEGWDTAKKLVDVRRLLQRIGTEAVRDIVGYDTWVNIIDRKVREAWSHNLLKRPQDGPPRFALTDCRFPNEAEWITSMGGVVWRITRPHETIADPTHPSESLLQSITPDVTIHNTGTLEDLQNAVVVVLAGGSKEVDAGELRGRAHSGWRETELMEREET